MMLVLQKDRLHASGGRPQKLVRDKASSHQGEFILTGIGAGKMDSLMPTMVLNQRYDMIKDVSRRGQGEGDKGEHDKPVRLSENSSFVEPFAKFSVGGELLQQDPKDLNDKRALKKEGGFNMRSIKIPKRMGKKDKSGMALPSMKEQKAPKKKSEIVDKQTKKVVKRKMDKAPLKMKPTDVDSKPEQESIQAA